MAYFMQMCLLFIKGGYRLVIARTVDASRVVLPHGRLHYSGYLVPTTLVSAASF